MSLNYFSTTRPERPGIDIAIVCKDLDKRHDALNPNNLRSAREMRDCLSELSAYFRNSLFSLECTTHFRLVMIMWPH